jgi:hypothetical protein
MKNPTFLTVARQGKNGWQRYLLGILVIAGMMTIVIIPVAMITFVGIYTSGTPLEKINQGNVQELISQSLIFGKPIPLIIFGGAINAMSLAGLFLAVTRVHKRPFRTLLSPEPEASIGWFRVIKGLIR